ncbi:MAG: hypothetical protein JWO38_2790 [Gemmataceae bacterium]|nr:hypothetical protein [Gemmataceae bacterium]
MRPPPDLDAESHLAAVDPELDRRAFRRGRRGYTAGAVANTSATRPVERATGVIGDSIWWVGVCPASTIPDTSPTVNPRQGRPNLDTTGDPVIPSFPRSRGNALFDVLRRGRADPGAFPGTRRPSPGVGWPTPQSGGNPVPTRSGGTRGSRPAGRPGQVAWRTPGGPRRGEQRPARREWLDLRTAWRAADPSRPGHGRYPAGAAVRFREPIARLKPSARNRGSVSVFNLTGWDYIIQASAAGPRTINTQSLTGDDVLLPARPRQEPSRPEVASGKISCRYRVAGLSEKHMKTGHFSTCHALFWVH